MTGTANGNFYWSYYGSLATHLTHRLRLCLCFFPPAFPALLESSDLYTLTGLSNHLKARPWAYSEPLWYWHEQFQINNGLLTLAWIWSWGMPYQDSYWCNLQAFDQLYHSWQPCIVVFVIGVQLYLVAGSKFQLHVFFRCFTVHFQDV